MQKPMSRPRSDAVLCAGNVVQVRTEDEILGTLDSSGRLGGLPFMPEMVRHCGETRRVFKRADVTCDSIWSPGMRQMEDAVFLWEARCDGSAHGGCQAGCLFFWREEWLRRLGPGQVPGASPISRTPLPTAPSAQPGCTRADLIRATTVVGAVSDTPTYSCQATELRNATSPLAHAPLWDVRQYAGEVRSGNVSAGHVLLVVARESASAIAHRVTRSRLGHKVLIPAGTRLSKMRSRAAAGQVPPEPGRAVDRSRDALNLQPGDRVRVRSRHEIEATLDTTGRNRGLSFNSEMHRYCGGEYRVLRRVERIINEPTGRMVTLKDDIILDGVTCQGDYHRFCPRAVYPYWREAWLQRLD